MALTSSSKEDIMKKIIFLAILCCGLLQAFVVAGQSSDINLISNGDFENPPEQPYAPNGFTIFEPTTQPGIPGWNVGCSGNVEMDNNRWQQFNNEGSNSVDLSGDKPGCIYQSFATVPGTTYSGSFTLAGNTACPPGIKIAYVTVGDYASAYRFDTSGLSYSNMGWTQVPTFYFTAISPQTTLTLASGDVTTSSCGPVVDKIVIKAV